MSKNIQETYNKLSQAQTTEERDSLTEELYHALVHYSNILIWQYLSQENEVLAHDISTRAILSLNKLRENAGLVKWFRKLAHNMCMDWFYENDPTRLISLGDLPTKEFQSLASSPIRELELKIDTEKQIKCSRSKLAHMGKEIAEALMETRNPFQVSQLLGITEVGLRRLLRKLRHYYV